MATLWIRNGPDVIRNGKAVKRRWSIIQVDKDRRGYGRIEGYWGRDFPNCGRDTYVFFRVHVPGLSPRVKGHMEAPEIVWERQFGEDIPDPEVIETRRYYLDFDALPEWAKISLQSEGDVTLPAHIAVHCVKRWSTGQTDRSLFELFEAM